MRNTSPARKEAQGLPLYIEGPVDAGNKPDQIRLLTAITKELTRLGSGVKIVADEWCNTYRDIVDFTDAASCHMVQIKTRIWAVFTTSSMRFFTAIATAWKRTGAAPAMKLMSVPAPVSTSPLPLALCVCW